MAQFIKLTSPSLICIRVNVDNIFMYCFGELPSNPVKMGTRIFGDSMLVDSPNDPSYLLVRETPDQIDRLINPTGTR